VSEGHDMQSGVWALQPLADMTATEFRDWQTLLEERTGSFSMNGGVRFCRPI